MKLNRTYLGAAAAICAATFLAIGCSESTEDDNNPGMTGGSNAGGESGDGDGDAGTGGNDPGGTGGAMGGNGGIGGGGGEAPICDDDDPSLDTGMAGATGMTGTEYGWNFSSADEVAQFGIKDAQYGGDGAFDTTTLAYDCGQMVITATWPHGDGILESNENITKTFVETNGSWDLDGQTLTLKIDTTDLGVPADASGGLDVYISVSDDDWTAMDGGGNSVDAAGMQTFTFDVPAEDADFKPQLIQQINIRVDNKYWDAVKPFDYGTSVIAIDSLTWAPTPT